MTTSPVAPSRTRTVLLLDRPTVTRLRWAARSALFTAMERKRARECEAYVLAAQELRDRVDALRKIHNLKNSTRDWVSGGTRNRSRLAEGELRTASSRRRKGPAIRSSESEGSAWVH